MLYQKISDDNNKCCTEENENDCHGHPGIVDAIFLSILFVTDFRMATLITAKNRRFIVFQRFFYIDDHIVVVCADFIDCSTDVVPCILKLNILQF